MKKRPTLEELQELKAMQDLEAKSSNNQKASNEPVQLNLFDMDGMDAQITFDEYVEDRSDLMKKAG